METFQTKAVLGEDGKLQLEVPCHLPPGPVDILVVMTPITKEVRWSDFVGVGKDIWQGEDAQEYVNRLRGGCQE